MATSQTSPTLAGEQAAATTEAASVKAQPKQPALIDRFLNLLSSVPFGIVLLILLISACMTGMLIQQQELESFPTYYAELTPAEKSVYGHLGFFDIYHVWYFNLLLLLLSLNIILASIDHFPAAWSFLAKKKLTASPTFAMAQKFKEKVELPGVARTQLVERVVAAAKATRFRTRVTESAEGNGRTTIFAERGVWNRLGAYIVHIGLLTIFLGGFLTSRGFNGSMAVLPKQSSDRIVQNVFSIDNAQSQHAVQQREMTLPFTIEGVDIQQKLINKEGGLEAGNTLDWLTRVRINDPERGKQTDALIHMNSPFDYRGYRFFQASFNPMGSARTVKLRVMPASGGPAEEVEIERTGEARLKDGTRVQYLEFNPSFTVTREMKVDVAGTEYENPAAHVAFITPDGKQGEAWAFNDSFANTIANAPMMKQFLETGPYRFTLADFEKVPAAHILSVQYDPGARVVYIGFAILIFALIAVFFFSHQRLWLVVEDGAVYAGGDANRNRLGFEDRARKLLARVQEAQ